MNDSTSPWRLVFMGTAELACASLTALGRDPRFQVAAVVTQPDRPKGRDLKLAFSPVKETALAMHLPVLQPEKARHETFLNQLRELQPDLILVAAYGQILPPAILALPRFGCLNVHTSLLPKYRGAAPIQWAILDDEPETGVTIMKMDAGLDTGDILTQATTPIAPEDNAQTLHDRLATLGAELLLRTIPDFIAGRLAPRPQPPVGATYARKITKEDGRIDWSQPARVVWNRVRGLAPWPGAFTFFGGAENPRLLKIWEAQAEAAAGRSPGEILAADKNGIVVSCGAGVLRIQRVQLEGGRRLTAAEFCAGHKFPAGARLGSS